MVRVVGLLFALEMAILGSFWLWTGPLIERDSLDMLPSGGLVFLMCVCLCAQDLMLWLITFEALSAKSQ